MMRSWWMAVLWAGLVVCMAGCSATGPRFSEMEKNLPALQENQGRIYFYRPSLAGAAIQPEVTVNGQVVGKSQPRSFFFIDRAAGNYRASTQTEVEATVDIPLKPRQNAYVEMHIGVGLFVGRPEFQRVAEAEGTAALASLAYGGPALQPASASTAAPAPPGVIAATRSPTTLPSTSSVPMASLPMVNQVNVHPPERAQAEPVPVSAAQPTSPRVVEYELLDRITKLRRKVVYRADPDEDGKISFNNGGWVEKPGGQVISITSAAAGEFDTAMPPGGWSRENLADAVSWTTRYSSRLGGNNINMDLRATVMEDSTLTVAGQEVKVVRIEYRGFTERFAGASTVSNGNQFGPYRANVWFSPEFGRVVRFEVQTRGGWGSAAYQVDEVLALQSVR